MGSQNIKNGAVGTSQIATGAVTTTQIADGTIALSDLATATINAFVQLVGLTGPIAIAGGTGTVNFSASTSSDTPTITHSLGRVPKIIVPISNGGNARWFAYFNATTTTAQVQGYSATAVTASNTFAWIAVG